MKMKHFNLIFGSLWTIITLMVAIPFYVLPGNVTVNGELMSKSEFNDILWPKLFFAGFFLIGFAFLVVGIFQVVKDLLTGKTGEECFAKVIDINHTNVTINGYPELKAKLLVYVPSLGTTKEVDEVIGTNPDKYPINSIVKVKYRNNDVVITDIVDELELPIIEEEQLKVRENKVNGQKGISTGVNGDVINTAADEIEINGVKYRKVDE